MALVPCLFPKRLLNKWLNLDNQVKSKQDNNLIKCLLHNDGKLGTSSGFSIFSREFFFKENRFLYIFSSLFFLY